MAEAGFDLMFLHMARWLKMRDSGASLTTIFSYWQLAFSTQLKAEGFSKYITRLCLASRSARSAIRSSARCGLSQSTSPTWSGRSKRP